jgi:hypothetical protein
VRKLKSLALYIYRIIRPLLKLCTQAWRSNHRFSALILMLVIPSMPLAKPRHERQANTDLYVMF